MIRILGITLLLISSHVSALTLGWVPLETAENNGNPLHINGKAVLEYKNAGPGGMEWEVSGEGPREVWEYANYGCLIIQQREYPEQARQPRNSQ